MRDAVFLLLGCLRCRERMPSILAMLPEERREGLEREFTAIAELSPEQAVARLCQLSSSADRAAREHMLRRWGAGFASEPAIVQRWLAGRAQGTRT